MEVSTFRSILASFVTEIFHECCPFGNTPLPLLSQNSDILHGCDVLSGGEYRQDLRTRQDQEHLGSDRLEDRRNNRKHFSYCGEPLTNTLKLPYYEFQHSYDCILSMVVSVRIKIFLFQKIMYIISM